MASEKDYQGLYDRIAALREQVASRLSADLISNPQLADALTKQIDDMLASVIDADAKMPAPPFELQVNYDHQIPSRDERLHRRRIQCLVVAHLRNG